MCVGMNCGYRSLWKILRTRHGLRVGKETVRDYLRYRDPQRVLERQTHRLHRRTYVSRGPNDCWHLDGYDKLKRYGFAISGCIDGYSRRIIFLRCSSTNNDPAVIGCYYLDAVTMLMRCPSKLRTDRGSENGTAAALQCIISGNLTTGHAFGTSHTNQRIESFWSFLRRLRIQWWIEMFEDLMQFGVLDTSHERQVECIRYCFMDIIQKELDDFHVYWNCHRIRQSAGAVCPGGIPDELYFLPPHGQDCMIHVDPFQVEQYRVHVRNPSICASTEYCEYLHYVLTYCGFNKPNTWQEAVDLYMKLYNLLFI